jgi:hypothetical protein
MGLTRVIALTALAAVLAGCTGVPLPPDKAEYAGQWAGPEMWLMISPEGQVAYKRIGERGTVTINGPITRYEGDDFIVGAWVMTSTFAVSNAPWVDEGGVWRMTVDGVELTRQAGSRAPAEVPRAPGGAPSPPERQTDERRIAI